MADFTSFKNTFQGDIVEPSSADYPAAIARWSVTAQRKARYGCSLFIIPDLVTMLSQCCCIPQRRGRHLSGSQVRNLE